MDERNLERAAHLDRMRDTSQGWYHLHTDGELLTIEVNESAFQFMQEYADRYFGGVSEDFGIPPIRFPSQDHEFYGFGDVFSCIGESRPGWVSISSTIPESSRGNINWEELTPFVLSVNRLLDGLQYRQFDTSDNLPQYVSVNAINSQGGWNSAAMGAEVWPALTEWVAANVDNEEAMDEITLIMQLVSERVWPGMDTEYTGARFSNPAFIAFDAPGDRAYVMSERAESGIRCTLADLKEEHQMSSHNVDGPPQQAILLAGFAKLEELAADERRRALAERVT